MSVELTKEQLLEYVKKQKVKIKKLETEVNSLKESAAQAPVDDGSAASITAELDAIKKDFAEKLNTIDELALSKQELTALNGSLQQENEHLRASQSELTDRLEQLEKKLADSKKVALSLKKQMTEATTLSDSRQQEFDKMSIECMKAQTAAAMMNELSKQLADSNATIDQLQNKLASTDKQISTEVTELQRTIKQLQEQLAASSLDLTSAVETVAVKDKKIIELESKVLDLEHKAVSQKQHLKELQQQLEEQQQQLEQQLQHLQQQLQVQDNDTIPNSKYLEKVDEIQRLAHDLLATKTAANSRISELTLKLDESWQSFDKQSQEKMALVSRVTSLEDELQALQALQHEQSAVKAATGGVTSDSSIIADLRAKYDETLRLLAKFDTSMVDANSDSHTAVGPTATPTTTASKSKKDKKKSKVPLDDTNLITDSTSKDTGRISTSITEAVLTDMDALRLQEILQFVIVINSSGSSKSHLGLSPLLDELKKLDASLSLPHSAVTEDATTTTNNNDTHVSAAAAEIIADLQHELAHARTHQQTADGDIARLTSQLEAMEGELAQLKADVEQTTANQTDAQHQLYTTTQKYEEQLAQLTSKLNENLSATHDQETALASELKSQFEVLTAQRDTALQTETTTAEECEVLKFRNNALQNQVQELERVNEKLIAAEASLQTLETVKKQLEQEYQGLCASNTELTSTLSATKAAMQQLAQSNDSNSALTAELATSSSTITTLETKVSELNSMIAANNTELSAAKVAIAELERTNSAINDECTTLQQRVEALTSSSDALTLQLQHLSENTTATASEESAQLQQQLQEQHLTLQQQEQQLQLLQATLVSRDNTIVELNAAANTASVTAAATAEATQQLEATNKKLMQKLKAKMKEVTDLTAAFNEASSKAGRSSVDDNKTLELTTMLNAAADKQQQLATLNNDLTSQLQHAVHERGEVEGRCKVLNETLIAGEERVSQLLREKNDLQEKVYAHNRQLEQLQQQLAAVNNSKCRMVEEKKVLEQQLQVMERNSQTSAADLQQQVIELTTNNNKLKAELAEISKALASATEEAVAHRDTTDAFAKAQKQSKRLTEEVQVLNEQLKEQQQDFQAKTDAQKEKISKLKTLLNKVNNLAQEKETRVSQLMSLNERAKVFSVALKTAVPRNLSSFAAAGSTTDAMTTLITATFHDDDDANVEDSDFNSSKFTSADFQRWCYVVEESDNSSKCRWVEESVVQQWLAEGSSLQGVMPDTLQDVCRDRFRSTKRDLERELQHLKGQYEELAGNFQTYKIRAQSALKRLGNDERTERHRQHEVEAGEIERLNGVISELEEAFVSGKSTISALEQTLQQRSTELNTVQSTLGTTNEALSIAQTKLDSTLAALESTTAAHDALRTEHEHLQEEKYRLTKQLNKKLDDEASLMSALGNTAPKPVDTNTSHNPDHVVAVASSATPAIVIDAVVVASNNNTNKTIADHNSNTYSNNASDPLPKLERIQSAREHNHDNDDGHSNHQHHSSNASPRDSNLLLYQQADQMLRESVQLLRRDNAALAVELNELKKDVGLREDQVQALKTTIRELEASLFREKEFNAANRRINADYLVNVLRKFLMSGVPTEREKLVSVLCTLLHLQPDESRQIAEKWAVRNTGLVGWLLPPRPPPITYNDDDVERKDDILVSTEPMHMSRGVDNNGNRKNSSGGGDLSYDPKTGSVVGLDF